MRTIVVLSARIGPEIGPFLQGPRPRREGSQNEWQTGTTRRCRSLVRPKLELRSTRLERRFEKLLRRGCRVDHLADAQCGVQLMVDYKAWGAVDPIS